jgi:amino acid adenylation domain-containing protein
MPATATSEQHVCGHPVSFVAWEEDDIETSIGARFARVASLHAGCLALADASGSYTYADLDAWSGAVADALIGRPGRGPEPVPLVFRQGAASTAATLGVLRAGKIYVPLDPDDPAPRLREAAGRVGARLVLHDRETETAAAAAAEPAALDALAIDSLRGVGARGDTPPLGAPGDAAYVFFTSGSTGRRKGVLDNHRNVLHNVLRYTNALRIGSADRLTLLQAPAFSGAVSSLFCALLNGAAVFPARPAGESPAHLAAWLRDNRITVYHSVPAIFRGICSAGGDFPDVRVVRLEGDRASSLDVSLHRAHFGDGSILANGLGTTETGLARQLRLGRDDPVEDGVVPVGYAVPGVEAAVVDEAGAELPPGAVGEIAVRSRHLALGYWEDPELTAAVFREDSADATLRTYLTGDMGRLRADGCLEHLGRRDFQLKVRGQRVDPTEIETALLRLSFVREAVVSTTEGRRGEGRLVGYVVPAGPVPPTPEIRAELGRTLPAAFVPSAFVVLGGLPLGPNGKVDRRALPSPLAGRTPQGEARTDLERRLVRLWEDVLEVPVGVDDDFFELGGDSLAAAEIVAGLEGVAGFSVPGSALLRAPTVAGLAAALDGPPPQCDSALVPLRPEGDGAPVVLVHDANGEASSFVSLLPRLAGRPVLAVETSDPGADLRPAELARRHVETLERADVGPPYVLVGHCYGAVVALEMARRLHDDGKAVAFLGLSGITPRELPGLASDEAQARWAERHWVMAEGTFLARALTPARHLARLPRGARLRYVRDRLGAVARRLARRRAADPRTVALAVQEGLVSYAPAPYGGEAVLFLSEESVAAYTPDPEHDWRRLAEGGLRTLVLPGSDDDLLRPPAIGRIADEILAYGS